MKRLFVFFVVFLLLFVVGCSDDTEVETQTESMGKPAEAGTAAETIAEDTMAGAVEDVAEDSFNTMKEIMARNVPMKCTWEFNEGGQKMSGETIVKGDKFKSESRTQGMTFSASSDGEWMYIWDSIKPAGTKIRLADMEEMGEGPQADSQPGSFSASSLEASYDYKCNPTVVSDSEFKPPSGKQFNDFSEFMKISEQLNQQMEAGEEINMEDLQKQLEAMQQG